MTQNILYNFDQIANRRESDSVKWNAYDPDVLPMWVADMDFISPEPVIQALVERARHGFFGYPVGLADHKEHLAGLRGAIIDWLSSRHHWQIQPDEIVFIPGVVTGFNLACKALASPDQAVMVQTPVYTPMLEVAQGVGIHGQEMELMREPDGSYSVDYDCFEAALTPETRLFLLCSPHNPVGKVFRRDELTRMAEACLRKHVLIISDEIHCDLVYSEAHHTPMAALSPEIAQSTITLMAPSKTFNLAGLQCSFAVIQNETLRKQYIAARGHLIPWVNLMGLTAGEAAYRGGADWLNQAMVYLHANRDLLARFVRDELPGVRMFTPEGTYLAWLDLRGAGLPGNPYRFFLDTARVALQDGARFGRGGEGFARLNFACPRGLLIEGLERIRSAMTAIQG